KRPREGDGYIGHVPASRARVTSPASRARVTCPRHVPGSRAWLTLRGAQARAAGDHLPTRRRLRACATASASVRRTAARGGRETYMRSAPVAFDEVPVSAALGPVRRN